MRDLAHNCDKFLHLTFVPAPLKLKQSNMNETNSLREASRGPESFILQPLKLKRRLLCWLCAENIASTWEYHQLGLWAGQLWGEITTTPISISVPIMCHRESYGQWIGPRANTERPLWALYHLRTIVTWPGFGHQSQGQDAGARRPPGALWPPVGGDWAPSPCYSPDQLLALWSIIHARHYWHPWFWAEKRFCEKWQNQNGHCASSATITVKL